MRRSLRAQKCLSKGIDPKTELLIHPERDDPNEPNPYNFHVPKREPVTIPNLLNIKLYPKQYLEDVEMEVIEDGEGEGAGDFMALVQGFIPIIKEEGTKVREEIAKENCL